MHKSITRDSLPIKATILTAIAAVVLFSHPGAYAQETNDKAVGQVSMCIYPVQRGEDGNQYIITKAGYKITVPGLGIAPDANEIAVYRDDANNYWYVDRNGATQKVSHQQLQWAMSQISQQQQGRGVPQTQMSAGQEVPNAISQNPQAAAQNYSAGTVAAASGMAAMGGAMAGSAIADSMYANNRGYGGIPYGVPCYNESGRRYYQGANGEPVPIADDTHNPYVNQWNQQTAYNPENREVTPEERRIGRDVRRGVRRLIHD